MSMPGRSRKSSISVAKTSIIDPNSNAVTSSRAVLPRSSWRMPTFLYPRCCCASSLSFPRCAAKKESASLQASPKLGKKESRAGHRFGLNSSACYLEETHACSLAPLESEINTWLSSPKNQTSEPQNTIPLGLYFC